MLLVPLHGAAGIRANGANSVNGAPVLTDSTVQLHGATGAAGAPGVNGLNGATGITGPSGAPGAPGANGMFYEVSTL